ncbi:hypothetical protein [Tardiphaga sp.]|jgi:hypothetical protein|uniref:hypothetical protein n=1 Tax=Tardiphaga sp. TaxID=1926292 RepID=UPI0037DA5118
MSRAWPRREAFVTIQARRHGVAIDAVSIAEHSSRLARQLNAGPDQQRLLLPIVSACASLSKAGENQNSISLTRAMTMIDHFDLRQLRTRSPIPREYAKPDLQ